MTFDIRILAPAKINLFLHVTGKRVDGYHLLESLVVFANWGDWLEITAAKTLELQVVGNGAASLEHEKDNLVLRAARLLQQKTGATQGARITLHKQIPIGAGLGGGSSDAAMTLKALSQLWQIQTSDASLHAMAISLGSDVPACLMQKPLWLIGAGETISCAEIPGKILHQLGIVLVNPRISLPTADVFRNFTSNFSHPAPRIPEINTTSELLHYVTAQRNDLDAAAISLVPQIQEILAALNATEKCHTARMSGSGATCFGLYASKEDSEEASHVLKSDHPDWWIQPVSLLRNND